MKTARSFFTACVAALACASAVAAADNPPAINLAALQAYRGGTGSIAGSTGFSKEGTAYCAPDVPYVNWYVSQLNSPRRPAYVLGRYTRTSPIGKDGAFTCSNLARGRYVVWVEGDRRVGATFSGPAVSSETNPNGQMGGPGGTSADRTDAKADKNTFGSDSASAMARFFAGPKHVVVGTSTVSVRI